MAKPGEGVESNFHNYHIIICKMSRFQYKSIIDMKKLGNVIHSCEIKKLVEIVPEEVQKLDLRDKDFKNSCLNMCSKG